MGDSTPTIWGIPLAAGCWSWGDSGVWGYPDRFDFTTIAKTFDVLVAGGVRYFDTAEVYGRGESERILGRLMAGTPAQIVVSSKFYPFPWRLSHRQFLSALESSAKRLGETTIAVYQIHQDAPWALMSRWIDYLASAREEGLIESIGTSNLSFSRLRRVSSALARHGQHLEVHQSRYNLVDRRVEQDGVLDFCSGRAIRFLAHSPLSQGLLGGSYSAGSPPPGRRGRAVSRDALEQIGIVVRHLRRTAKRLDVSVAEVSLAWLREKGAVPLVGSNNPKHAAMILRSVDLKLPTAVMDELNLITEPWTRAA